MLNKRYGKLLKKFGFNGYSEGNSMLPIIFPGDRLYIKPVKLNQLEFNDILTFYQKSKLITHRVIYKTKNYLITKGDNSPRSDGKIYQKNIIGAVYKINRNKQTIIPENIYLIQSTLYFQEITKIIRTFEKESINYVILKGLPLHLFYEKSHPKRIFADCDILIKKQDFQKVEKIIKKFGYINSNKNNKKVENNYFKTINGFSVIFDIHLEPAFLMTQISGLEALYSQKLINQLSDELLENKRQITINNERLYILNTKYLILYLALHIFHHNFRGAFRYQFLDRIIKKSQPSVKDWQFINLKIREFRLHKFVGPVCFLLEKYYSTPIPTFLIKSFQPLSLPAFKYYLKLNIFNDEARIQAGVNRFFNIILLSPNAWWKKIFVFVNPSVWYFIFWTFRKKLSSFFLNRKAGRINHF